MFKEVSVNLYDEQRIFVDDIARQAGARQRRADHGISRPASSGPFLSDCDRLVLVITESPIRKPGWEDTHPCAGPRDSSRTASDRLDRGCRVVAECRAADKRAPHRRKRNGIRPRARVWSSLVSSRLWFVVGARASLHPGLVPKTTASRFRRAGCQYFPIKEPAIPTAA